MRQEGECQNAKYALDLKGTGLQYTPLQFWDRERKRENMARKSVKKATEQTVKTAEKVVANGQPAPKSPALATQVAAIQALPAPAAQAPKPTAQPGPVKSPEKVTAVAEAPVLSVVPKVKVTFVFPACECCAKRVSLSGDFNGWSPDTTPMVRSNDGHWETTVELAPGRYEYKFVRDGEWMPDLLAAENVWNGYGTLNSVIQVRA